MKKTTFIAAVICFAACGLLADSPLSSRDLIAAIESQREQVRDLSQRLTKDQRKSYRAHVEHFVDEVDKADQ
jgi:hypothetical protein